MQADIAGGATRVLRQVHCRALHQLFQQVERNIESFLGVRHRHQDRIVGTLSV
jgi:hypothetical protein